VPDFGVQSPMPHRRLSVLTAVLPAASTFFVACAESVRDARAQLIGIDWELEWIVAVDGPGESPEQEAESRHVVLPRRAGIAAARNTALSAASGAWVLPLDADDLLDPRGLLEIVHLLETLPPEVVWVGASRMAIDGRPSPHTLDRQRTWPRHSLEEHWTAPFPLHPNVVVARRATALLAGGWPGLDVTEDLLYLFSLGSWGDGLSVPHPLVRHRVWEGQVTQVDYPQRKALAFAVIEQIVNARRLRLGLQPIAGPTDPGGRFGEPALAPRSSASDAHPGGQMFQSHHEHHRTTRMAIVADVHGDLALFKRLLDDAGVNVALTHVPEDVVVVQIGDLIGTGPQPTECVRLADALMRKNEGRFIQLWGNHEAMVLFHRGECPPDAPDAAVAVLEEWWRGKRPLVAMAIRDAALGSTLITHAGVTPLFWKEIGAESAAATAHTLNQLVGAGDLMPFRQGRLWTREARRDVGPIWAEVNQELYLPWIEYAASDPLPFSQIHGHASPWHAPADAFWPGTPESVSARCAVLPEDCRTVMRVGGRQLISVDWASNARGGQTESQLFWCEGTIST
jgi:hypothetical protein